MFLQKDRSINLLPAMERERERIVAVRIQRHKEELPISPEEQFGFRHRHFNNHQIIRLVEYYRSSFPRSGKGIHQSMERSLNSQNGSNRVSEEYSPANNIVPVRTEI